MAVMARRLRVGVLFGGRSAEHEVSILSARNVVESLDPARYEPVLVGIDTAGRWSLQQPAVLRGAQDPRLVHLNPTAPTVILEPIPKTRELAAEQVGAVTRLIDLALERHQTRLLLRSSRVPSE